MLNRGGAPAALCAEIRAEALGCTHSTAVCSYRSLVHKDEELVCVPEGGLCADVVLPFSERKHSVVAATEPGVLPSPPPARGPR